jgi:hypothetical protein
MADDARLRPAPVLHERVLRAIRDGLVHDAAASGFLLGVAAGARGAVEIREAVPLADAGESRVFDGRALAAARAHAAQWLPGAAVVGWYAAMAGRPRWDQGLARVVAAFGEEPWVGVLVSTDTEAHAVFVPGRDARGARAAPVAHSLRLADGTERAVEPIERPKPAARAPREAPPAPPPPPVVPARAPPPAPPPVPIWPTQGPGAVPWAPYTAEAPPPSPEAALAAAAPGESPSAEEAPAEPPSGRGPRLRRRGTPRLDLAAIVLLPLLMAVCTWSYGRVEDPGRPWEVTVAPPGATKSGGPGSTDPLGSALALWDAAGDGPTVRVPCGREVHFRIDFGRDFPGAGLDPSGAFWNHDFVDEAPKGGAPPPGRWRGISMGPTRGPLVAPQHPVLDVFTRFDAPSEDGPVPVKVELNGSAPSQTAMYRDFVELENDFRVLVLAGSPTARLLLWSAWALWVLWVAVVWVRIVPRLQP